MTIITDERCIEYSAAGHPERPARVARTLETLRTQEEVKLAWDKPASVDDDDILRAHERTHLDRVRAATEAFDGDTPAHANIFQHAQRAVGAGLRAMALARKGEISFSLMRPPGHHATRHRAMGFCYLNSVAIAALAALAAGAKQVAIFDFDVHHGNGTEAILVNKPHTSFYSIHQHPCYPGTGTQDEGDNCFNFPVPPKTPRPEYRRHLTRALEQLTKAKPDLIGVSAGFDAYARDPLAQETLEAEDFYWIGESLRNLGIPIFSLLEGGYSSDLPELILSYLRGLSGQ